MCGRYVRRSDKQKFAEHFRANPNPAEGMEVHEANPKVGNIRNNGPEMMRAAAKAAEDGELPL